MGIKFSNGKTAVSVKTVGDIRKEIKVLPDDMEVCHGMISFADLVIHSSHEGDWLEVDDGGLWVE